MPSNTNPKVQGILFRNANHIIGMPGSGTRAILKECQAAVQGRYYRNARQRYKGHIIGMPGSGTRVKGHVKGIQVPVQGPRAMLKECQDENGPW